MGGTTAALAIKEESRILAGINLDGSTYPGMNGDIRPVPVHKLFLFLATEEHASGKARAREYIGKRIQYLLRGGDWGRSHELYRCGPCFKQVRP
jgi:hypothetical protein